MSKAVFTVHSSPESLPEIETLRFAGCIHPHLKLATPIAAKLERSRGAVRASAKDFGVSVLAASSGEALACLGKAIADLYYEKKDAGLSEHIAEKSAPTSPSRLVAPGI